MFWALIVEDEVLGPFRVADGVKKNSEGYCASLEEHFFLRIIRKLKMIVLN